MQYAVSLETNESCNIAGQLLDDENRDGDDEYHNGYDEYLDANDNYLDGKDEYDDDDDERDPLHCYCMLSCQQAIANEIVFVSHLNISLTKVAPLTFDYLWILRPFFCFHMYELLWILSTDYRYPDSLYHYYSLWQDTSRYF